MRIRLAIAVLVFVIVGQVSWQLLRASSASPISRSSPGLQDQSDSAMKGQRAATRTEVVSRAALEEQSHRPDGASPSGGDLKSDGELRLYDQSKFSPADLMHMPTADLLVAVRLSDRARRACDDPKVLQEVMRLHDRERRIFVQAGRELGERVGAIGAELRRSERYSSKPSCRYLETQLQGRVFYIPESEFPEVFMLQDRRNDTVAHLVADIEGLAR